MIHYPFFFFAAEGEELIFAKKCVTMSDALGYARSYGSFGYIVTIVEE